MSHSGFQPRLRVVSSSFALDQGGIARVGRLMSKALAQSDIEFDLLALDDKVADRSLGIGYTTCGGSRARYLSALWPGAVSHTHHFYNHMGLARAHPRLPLVKRPYMTWIFGIDAWGPVKPAYLAAAHGASRILSISNFTKERASRENAVFERAKVCWLATEEDESPATPASFSGPPTVLVVSRISSLEGYKGHDALIALWPEISAAVPGARLLIAGGGDGLAALRARIGASPVADAIEVLGFVEEAQMPALWRRAHVFAMPSRGEGFGLVYIEAMRHGVPVIASIHDAGQEVNAHGETGFNVSLDHAADLKDKVVTLLRNPDLAQRMGAAGRERWRTHFRFSAFRDRFVPLVREFMSR